MTLVERYESMNTAIIRRHDPQVVRDNGNWVAYLPGLPLAVEEPELDTAIGALIEGNARVRVRLAGSPAFGT